MKGLNLNYDLTERPFPVHIIVETAALCNLRCCMCPYPVLKRPKGVMSEEVFRRVVAEIAEVDKNTKIWPALLGEPLMLGENFFSLIGYAKSKRLSIHLNTNGMLIRENLRDLLSSGMDEIIVGIDAATKEIYEQIRVGGDFDCVVENVKLLLENRADSLSVLVQLVEMSDNRHEVDTFKTYWLNQGAGVKIRRQLGWGRAISSELGERKVKRLPCPWLFRTLTVHWDGSVVQCDGDYEARHSVGNVLDVNLYDLWNGPLKERRQRHLRNDFDFEPCRTCFDWACGLAEFYYPEDKVSMKQ